MGREGAAELIFLMILAFVTIMALVLLVMLASTGLSEEEFSIDPVIDLVNWQDSAKENTEWSESWECTEWAATDYTNATIDKYRDYQQRLEEKAEEMISVSIDRKEDILIVEQHNFSNSDRHNESSCLMPGYRDHRGECRMDGENFVPSDYYRIEIRFDKCVKQKRVRGR